MPIFEAGRLRNRRALRDKWMSTNLRLIGALCAFLVITGTLVPLRVIAAQRPDYTTLSPAQRLAYQGGLMRLGAAESIDTILSRLPAGEAQLVDKALGLTGGAADKAWSWVFVSAVQFQRVDGDAAQTFWWNPAIDAGVAITWRQDGAIWRITGAAPLLGEAVRGEKLAFRGAPAWSSTPNTQTVGKALADVSLATQRAVLSGRLRAAMEYPVVPDAVLGRAGVVDAGLQGHFDITAIRRNRLVFQRITRASLIHLPSHPDVFTVKLGQFTLAERRMFAPRLVALSGSGATTLWISAGATDRAFLLHYPDHTSLEPSAIEAIDLSTPNRSVP